VVERHIQARFPDGPATEPGDSIHQEGLFLQRIAAESHLDSGDTAGARAWIEAHDRWLDWSSSVLGRADGRLLWARWHRASGDVAAAHAAVSEAISLADAPTQPLVRAAAHRTLAELDTAAGLGAMAEAHLTTALAIEETCEAPFERALTLLALAELRLAMGATGEAAALLDEVRMVCARLGAEPTLSQVEALAARIPTQASAAPPPAGLTPRELEVLRLLAQRLSNPEIADVLVVGQRTVQTHVEHILGKLGVSNRREAAAAAARLGLI
jgi:DNA-binding CsgD family transcriptional regulator